MFRVIAVAWAVVFGLCVNSSQAAEFRANYVELATLVRAALKDAEIHLNNKPNDGLFALIGPKQSYVKLGTVEIPFDVPPHPRSAPTTMCTRLSRRRLRLRPPKERFASW